MVRNTQIVLLGTGNPALSVERSQPSLAIVVNGSTYIVDFGLGTAQRVMQATKAGIEECHPSHLKATFLTHTHLDHILGLPGLIYFSNLSEHKEPLKIYGPKGTIGITNLTLALIACGLDDHLSWVESDGSTTSGIDKLQGLYKTMGVEAYEIEPGLVHKDLAITVEAFPVNHSSLKAFGYFFTTPDLKIAVSGDTGPLEGLVEAYAGCDILIHEVYSREGLKNLGMDAQDYQSAVHTSSSQLAEIASIVKPRLLILNHALLFGASEEQLLREIREEYEGDVVLGRDLQVFRKVEDGNSIVNEMLF